MSTTALPFPITLSSAAPANSRRDFLATHTGLRDVFYRTDPIHPIPDYHEEEADNRFRAGRIPESPPA